MAVLTSLDLGGRKVLPTANATRAPQRLRPRRPAGQEPVQLRISPRMTARPFPLLAVVEPMDIDEFNVGAAGGDAFKIRREA